MKEVKAFKSISGGMYQTEEEAKQADALYQGVKIDKLSRLIRQYGSAEIIELTYCVLTLIDKISKDE